jgi:hypothetical protein
VAHYPVLWVVCAELREVGVQAPLPMYAAGFVVALTAGAVLVRLRSRWGVVDALFVVPPRGPRRSTPRGPGVAPRTAMSDER